MSEPAPELVERIVREVVAALERRAPEEKPPGEAPGAPIRPPVGVCTGDYSQFPELRGRLHGRGNPDSAPRPAREGPAPLEGIVTASRLADALGSAPDGTALLAPSARLTPLAMDLAREQPRRVRRAASEPDSAATARWLLWAETRFAVTERLAAQAGDVARVPADEEAAALGQAAEAIEVGRAAGAVVLVRDAARAMMLANRRPPLRAVLGTCPEAVGRARSAIGANVLILEPPYHGAEALEAMAEKFLAAPPERPRDLDRALEAVGAPPGTEGA